MFEKSREGGAPSKKTSDKRKAARALVVGAIAAVLAFHFKDDIAGYIPRRAEPVVETVATAGPPPYAAERIAGFAAEAYTAIMTIRHPVTLDAHMDALSGYLTDAGYTSLKDAFRISRIVDSGQNIGVTLVAAPRITDVKRIDGVWRWTVDFPADIAFSNPRSTRADPWNVTLAIEDTDRKRPAVAQVIAVPR